jgi:protein transport protein SEC24
VPLGVVLQPFAEQTLQEEPLTLLTTQELLRCSRCRSYVNPNYTFKANSAVCNLCKMAIELPNWYYSVTIYYFFNLLATRQPRTQI